MKTPHRGRAATLAAATFAFLVSCSGPETSVRESGSAEGTWRTVDPAELNDMLQNEDIFLVNVHVPYEGEIPGTDAFIPYDRITERIGELPSDTSKLVIYCRSGNMSTEAAHALVAAGVTGFSELAGGYNAWEAEGLPFRTNPPPD